MRPYFLASKYLISSVKNLSFIFAHGIFTIVSQNCITHNPLSGYNALNF